MKTVVTADPASLGFSQERLERISAWMDRYVDAGKLPCALTLICRHGEVVFARAVGQRDLDRDGFNLSDFLDVQTTHLGRCDDAV